MDNDHHLSLVEEFVIETVLTRCRTLSVSQLMHENIITMQRIVRGFLVRRRQERQSHNNAAMMIQFSWRQALFRNSVEKHCANLSKIRNIATNVQCCGTCRQLCFNYLHNVYNRLHMMSPCEFLNTKII